MPSPKSGKAGKPVAPAAPPAAHEADVADPGKVAKIKKQDAEKQEGKYASEKVKPHKKPKDDQEDEQKTSWIEIELVGEDDQPIPGEKYKVVLPDKTVAQGTLDQNGWVRVEGFEAGDCKVSFPNLDKDAWEFIESGGAKQESA